MRWRKLSWRIPVVCFICSISVTGLGQGFEKVYGHKEKKPLIRLVEKEEPEYFLSPRGEYLISNTSEAFKIISGTTGEEIVGGDHIPKNTKNAKLAKFALGNSAESRLVESVAFNEGAGFYAFDEENIVIFLDWNQNENFLKAYDTQTGEKLWETNNYRFRPGQDQQLAVALATIAAEKVVNHTLYLPSLMAEGAFFSIENPLTGSYGSQAARAFITPLEGSGSFILKVNNEQVCLDLATGKEKWIYNDYPLNIADHQMVPEKNEVFLVNFNPTYWKKSENLIIKLDTETGEEKFRIEHMNNYAHGRTHLVDDRLVLDYYGIEVYDVPTGERILLTVDEKTADANDALMDVIGLAAGQRTAFNFSNPSWINNGIIYTATENRNGTTYPTFISSKKPQFNAYDLRSGQKVWTTAVHQKGSSLVGLTENGLVLRAPKGFGKARLVAVDRVEGKTIKETDEVKQYLFRDGAGQLIGEEKVLFSGKKGIRIFDTETWEQEGMLDVKVAKVGKPQAIGEMPGGFFVVADRGAAFYDEEGKFISSLKIKKVESALWTDENLIVMGKKTVTAIDLVRQKAVGVLPVAETMLASHNLKHWLIYDGKKTEKYSLLSYSN